MNEKLISVIIPVYNTAEYLPRCLDSIRNNTYRNLEIICVNDGSKDNSLEVLNAYAQKDSRIRVIDQKNAGVSAARNRGLDEATGEYIAFVDSDDWVHGMCFEILLNCITSLNADLCTAPYLEVCDMVPNEPVDWNVQGTMPITEEYIITQNCSVWGKLYRAQLLGNVRFHDGVRIGEDTIFNLDLFHQNAEIKAVKCASPLYYYFYRATSAYHTMKPDTYLPMIEWYLDHLKCAHANQQRLYIEEAVKNFLVWRYASMFSLSTEKKQLQKSIRSRLVSGLRFVQSLRAAKHLCYRVFLMIPLTYRLFRILDDPTILGWERQQREKAKAEKQK